MIECYYNRPQGEDCSNWNYSKVNNQLDYCETTCMKYNSCYQISYLNDRLVELDMKGE